MELFKRHKSGVLNQTDVNTSTVPKPTNGKPVNDADCKQFGLVNFGNTCYANSILQALYFCKPFRQFVCEFNDGSLPLPLPVTLPPTPAPPATPIPKPPGLSPFPFRRRESTINAGRTEDHSSVSSRNNVSTPAATATAPPTLFSALRSLFLHIALNPTDKGTVSPTSFIDKVKDENPAYRSAMHQDAHEFLGFLLNRVAENIKDVMKKNPHPPEINGNANGSTELSSSLGSLPGPSSVTNSSGSRQRRAGDTFIQDLFEGTLTSETRCLTCENVSSRDESFLDLSIDIEQNCSITACLRQFSASEMLAQKNKFFCDACGSLQEAEKRMKIKKLPNVLALHLKRFKYQEDRYVKLSYRVPFPFELRLFNTIDDAPDPDRLYQLFAIVVHIGVGAHHGHYITIIKSRGTWYTFDDDSVQPIREGDISKYFGGTSGESGYVLFYQAADLETTEPTAAPAPSEVAPTSASTRDRSGSVTTLLTPAIDIYAPVLSPIDAVVNPSTSLTESETSTPLIRPPDTSVPRAMPINLKLTVPTQSSIGGGPMSASSDTSKGVAESKATTPTATLSKTSFKGLRSPSFSRKKRPKSSGLDSTENAPELPNGVHATISSPHKSKSLLFSSSIKKSEKSVPPPLPVSIADTSTSSATTTTVSGTDNASSHVKEGTADNTVVAVETNGAKETGSSSSTSVSVSASTSSVSVAIPSQTSTSDASQLPPVPPVPPIPTPPSSFSQSKDKDQSSIAAPFSPPIPSGSSDAPLPQPSFPPPPPSPARRRNSVRPVTSPSFSPPDTLKSPSESPPVPKISETAETVVVVPPPSRARSFSASTSIPVTRSESRSKGDASVRQSMPPTSIQVLPTSTPPPIPERSSRRSAAADKSADNTAGTDKPAVDKTKTKSRRKRLQEFLLGFGH